MQDVQLLAIASTAVLAAQHFPCATDEWEAMAPALKTWATWKTTHRHAHIAWKPQLPATRSGRPVTTSVVSYEKNRVTMGWGEAQ